MKTSLCMVLAAGLFALVATGCGTTPEETMAPAAADPPVCEACVTGAACPDCPDCSECPDCAVKTGMGDAAALTLILAPIEKAHNQAAYDAHGAAGKVVRADFDVDFGGGDLIAGTMWYDTPVGRVRMELDDGTVVVFDGQTAWATQPDPEQGPNYRFHALTWPYFMAAPFKLNDPGTFHADAGEQPLTPNSSVPASKLTFGDGVGDAPDDWYLVFKNPDDNTLMAMAYIVTYGKDVETAEAKPSIIFYRDPVTVEDVTFATTWVFHYWNPETGLDGDAKGRATLSNIAFVAPPAGAFDKPEDAVESAMPAPQ